MMDPLINALTKNSLPNDTSARGQRGGTDILVYSLLAAIFFFRLVYAYFLGIVPDEAYYWDWSRSISWGYFDHPPMIAWLISLSRNIFGDTTLGVRAATIACAFLASVVSYLAAKKYVKKNSSLLLWVILSNSVVLFCAGSVLATPDIPLVLFWSLSLFLGYNAVFESSSVSWILLGLAAGLGFLSKYTFALFPLSLVVFLAISREQRSWFARWQPYAAACLAFLVFLPNLVWNLHHQWSAVFFQASHGFDTHTAIRLDMFGDFIAGQLGVLSLFPFVLLVWAVVYLFKQRPAQSRILYLISFCLVPFVFFLAASLQKKVEANWAACAYVSGFILISLFWENLDPKKNRGIRRFAAASAAISVIAAAVILLHIQRPFLPLPPQNDPATQVRGWENLARDIDRIRVRFDPLRVLPVCANRYQEASLFGFYLPDHPKTFALNTGSRDNQYSLWPQRRPATSVSVLFLHSPGDPYLDTIFVRNFSLFALCDTAVLYQGKNRESTWGVFKGMIR
jgi:4-amino-4-deoxy-L-arabinose transferase-like glycosyltransferase